MALLEETLTKDTRTDYGTPWEFFEKLNEEFRFTIDAAAGIENTKCERFWSEADDCLQQDWRGEVVWLNPPYGPSIPTDRSAAFATPREGIACGNVPVEVRADRVSRHFLRRQLGLSEPLLGGDFQPRGGESMGKSAPHPIPRGPANAWACNRFFGAESGYHVVSRRKLSLSLSLPIFSVPMPHSATAPVAARHQSTAGERLKPAAKLATGCRQICSSRGRCSEVHADRRERADRTRPNGTVPPLATFVRYDIVRRQGRTEAASGSTEMTALI